MAGIAVHIAAADLLERGHDERPGRKHLTNDATATDEELLMAVASGDQRAFVQLIERHADAVHGYLLRMTRSRADTEDFAQETFLRIWRKAHTYRPGRVRVSTWIHRIAHNLAVDGFRRRRDVAALETVAGRSNGEDPLEAHARRQQVARLEEAIGRLPENQRAALLLCQLQGFSNAEAGAILGVNLRAVESLLARARRTLRSTLGEISTDGGADP